MSRLIVKNLPPEINKLDLEHIFNQNGQITEISLKKDSQGRSRNFAFIGYHNEHDADQAMKSLNNTFIKTNKIQVERCLNIPKEKRNNEGESNKRKMSQSDSRQPRKKQKRFKEDPVVRDILVEKYQTDPEFAEFLDLKSPGQAAKVRAVLNLPNKNKAEKVPSNTREPVKQQKLKRGDIINLLYHVKLRDLPRGTNKKMIEEFFDPIHCASIRTVKSVRSIAYVGFMHEDERKRALAKNKNYIKGQCIRVIEYNDNYTRKQVLRKRSSTRIYFNDLPGINTVDDVKKIFSVYGEIKSIVMPKNANNELKGFGLVSYVNGSDAGKAYKELRRTALRSKVVIGPEQNPRVSQSKLTECLLELGETLEEYQCEEGDEEVDDDVDEEDDEKKPTNKKWKNQEDALKNEESVAESGRIFMRNLSYTTEEADIEKLFGTYGPITEINLPIDNDTKRPVGFGIVTFLMPEHAVKAFTELDGTILHGRMLHLLPGKNKDKPEVEESSNFKENKLNKQKAQAGKAHNWNALFVDHNAVAEVIADKFGTSKEAILGPETKGSAAVRLALAETQIVYETKKYLEEMGVKLEAFNQGQTMKRSKTIILVKNLPSRTEPNELREIFQKHGQIGRLILPPSGLTAIIEFLTPSEARKAFVSLAYSKFKNMPLYLQWAPDDSLDNKKDRVEGSSSDKEKPNCNIEVDQDQPKNIDGDDNIKINKTNEKNNGDVSDNLNKANPEPGTTIFVKNINFQTRNDALRTHFEQIGPLHYAYVVMKKADNSKESSALSRGYGFVRYMFKKDADRALEQLQQSVLEGKSLELARSDRSEKDEMETEKPNKDKLSKVKLIIKNIPFEAKTKEVAAIFSAFGGLKRVKLPTKIGAEANRHRGFAFVDFTNESDAKAAYEALHLSTHLLGRRLILQWAKDEEDLNELRKKMEEHYAPQKKAENKKSIFNID